MAAAAPATAHRSVVGGPRRRRRRRPVERPASTARPCGSPTDDLDPCRRPTAGLQRVEQVRVVGTAEHQTDAAAALSQPLGQGEQRGGGVPLADEQAAAGLSRQGERSTQGPVTSSRRAGGQRGEPAGAGAARLDDDSIAARWPPIGPDPVDPERAAGQLGRRRPRPRGSCRAAKRSPMPGATRVRWWNAPVVFGREHSPRDVERAVVGAAATVIRRARRRPGAARAGRRRRSRCRPGRASRPAASRSRASSARGDAADGDDRDRGVARARAAAAPRASAAAAPDRTVRRRRAPRPRAAGVRRPSREIVVLVAISPSRPRSRASSATATTSSSARSGAILTQQRDAAAGGVVGHPAYLVEEGCQPVDGLQAAQARGVGRGDVDDEVVGVRREQACAERVVGEHGLLVVLRHHLGLADVDAEDRARPGALADPARRAAVAAVEPRRPPASRSRHDLGAVVVEPHPVHDRPVLREAGTAAAAGCRAGAGR